MKKILLLLLSVVLFSCESDSPSYDVEKPKDTTTIGYITEPAVIDGKTVSVTYKYNKKGQKLVTDLQNSTFKRTDGKYTIQFKDIVLTKVPNAFPEEGLGFITFGINTIMPINYNSKANLVGSDGEIFLEAGVKNPSGIRGRINIYYIDNNTIDVKAPIYEGVVELIGTYKKQL